MDQRNGVSREELLHRRVEMFSQTPEKVKLALERIREARQKNKEIFDRKHKLNPCKIETRDWVLISDNNLDEQHSIDKKVARRWKGPYVVLKLNPNVTYKVRELDGIELKTLIARRRIKFFRRQIQDQDVFAEDLEEEVSSGDLEEEVENLEDLFGPTQDL